MPPLWFYLGDESPNIVGDFSRNLMSQQWHGFTEQFMDLLSWPGMLTYGVSLVFVKVQHEHSHVWGTWIYRLFLFLGTGYLVYAFFVRVVAIFLFCVEIVRFIALPIAAGFKKW